MHRRRDLLKVMIGSLLPPDGGGNRDNSCSLKWAGWWDRHPNLGNRCHILSARCNAQSNGILDKVANSQCHNHLATDSGEEAAGVGDK